MFQKSFWLLQNIYICYKHCCYRRVNETSIEILSVSRWDVGMYQCLISSPNDNVQASSQLQLGGNKYQTFVLLQHLSYQFNWWVSTQNPQQYDKKHLNYFRQAGDVCVLFLFIGDESSLFIILVLCRKSQRSMRRVYIFSLNG